MKYEYLFSILKSEKTHILKSVYFYLIWYLILQQVRCYGNY